MFRLLKGASAACRGGTSAHDADAVTRFLIQLACDRSSSIPFTSESVSVPLDEINLAVTSSEPNLQIRALESTKLKPSMETRVPPEVGPELGSNAVMAAFDW